MGYRRGEADPLHAQCKDAVHVRDQRLVEVQKAAVDDEEQKVVLVQGWPNQVKMCPHKILKF